jgi:hypothetical protein
MANSSMAIRIAYAFSWPIQMIVKKLHFAKLVENTQVILGGFINRNQTLVKISEKDGKPVVYLA